MSYTSSADIVSYTLGRQFGDQLAADPFDGLNAEAMAQGLMDTLSGKANPIDQAAMQDAFQEINDVMMAKQAEKAKEAAAEGEAFLMENAKKDNVVVLESGLQYEILVEGNGEKPKADSVVSTHYHGTLIDGTVFDSSVERGQPAEFPVNRVIAGWTEALQLMPVGSKWRLTIPYDLAYGEQGSSGAIGPYQTLVFEVELLGIAS
ncbi:FKBP-type peptidyl-prolyl cis-trans isomerase [Hydrogenovibrio sp. JE_KL2]|jgi:FKBP-type peptidyl-prolyl cis-trans isomerase FklB|uniref:FKBP-type peptidyl-prolyl cis-trans isomerase n=1 Tax=Hydrogenovibrio sp. JE_KL2 TaxID=2651188 RepID=UPI00128DA1F0|nr:FKBP-type peptidyl-prolyl cis-trans isomerase [Hydrogenovibrio sp. JE_KL2]MBD3821294.1 FKBP-type peptidyl-prolyl cis-trans isomerase [Thiotrichales bacterium]MPQ76152.1 FKBP-type peptidyl-prolyl cis-trans isomerase [Hydrogenovibrio sp. JE_KL2]